jgi:hypothetical protein
MLTRCHSLVHEILMSNWMDRGIQEDARQRAKRGHPLTLRSLSREERCVRPVAPIRSGLTLNFFGAVHL